MYNNIFIAEMLCENTDYIEYHERMNHKKYRRNIPGGNILSNSRIALYKSKRVRPLCIFSRKPPSFVPRRPGSGYPESSGCTV